MGSMLAACGDATEWERVLQIFLHVKNSKLSNMFTYGAAITACSRGGAWPQALHLLSQARKDSCCDAICMNAAISACRSNWELSVALLQEANEERLDTAVAYAAVMTACDRCEQPVKVLACWAAIPKKSHAAACSLALRACEATSSWNLAMRCLQSALKELLQPDAECIGAAIGASIEAWQSAMLLMKDATQRSLQLEVGAVVAYASALRQGGCFQKLRRLLGEVAFDLGGLKGCRR
ncbi:unnamed protein product [Durusdinium trenchii]